MFVLVTDEGKPVPPMDCNPGTGDEGMMVYRTKEGADKSAIRQREMFDVDCHAIPLSELEGV